MVKPLRRIGEWIQLFSKRLKLYQFLNWVVFPINFEMRARFQGHEGSALRGTDANEEGAKNRRQTGTQREGRAKPHQKAIHKVKNSFMKTRRRKEWDGGREDGLMSVHGNNERKKSQKQEESTPQRGRLHVQIFSCWSKTTTRTHVHECTHNPTRSEQGYSQR